MTDSKLKEEIKRSALSILTEEQLDLVEMKFSDLGPTWFLRVFVDKPGGVTVEDCAKASQRIADCLDTEDLIPHKYLLEVSSPGLDRPLETESDFKRKIGEEVKILLKEKSFGNKEIKGRILRLEGDRLILKDEDKEIAISLSNIAEAKIIF